MTHDADNIAMDCTLNAISDFMLEDKHIYGVLIFGSALRSLKQAGDVDIICLSDRVGVRRKMRHFSSSVLDIHESNLATLRNDIKKVFGSSNYILFGLTFGRILHDPSEAFRSLQHDAKIEWSAGPRARTRSELRSICYSAEKIASSFPASLDQWVMRNPHLSHEVVNGIVEVTAADLFLKLIGRYCHVKRLWSSKLNVMLAWTDPRYDYLQTIIRTYFSEDSLIGKRRIAVEFSRIIHEEATRFVPGSR